MEHYVTLFDGMFLPQGLALHRSLQRHAGRHTLWILCIDETAYSVLTRLALPDVRMIRLSDVETDELRAVKSTRSRAEYCWTLTPFAPGFVFDADPSVDRATYVDADTWLVRTPQPIFDEFTASGKAVLITEHAYASDQDQSDTSGRFCVQFMPFVRDRGEEVRLWWAQRCIEWCYARLEGGKFGDQMYLDDWPSRFANDVHVLGLKTAMQAPWNASLYRPSDALIYHFHGLRLLRHGRILISDRYRINSASFRIIYVPYCRDLLWGLQELGTIGHHVRPQVDRPLWLTRLRVLAQQVRLRWRERAPSRFARIG